MKKSINLLKIASFVLMSMMIIPLVSCGGGASSETSSEGIKVEQVVNVKVFDSFYIQDLDVELYDSNNNLVGSGLTDDKGVAKIDVSSYGEYSIKIGNDSPGFYVDSETKTSSSGEEVSINCKTKLIDANIPSRTRYTEGSIVHDFKVNLTDGTSLKASDYLKDHDAIFLNFWATWCGYCIQEFPLIQQASEYYDDRVAFVALSATDTMNDVISFKGDYGYTFDFGLDATDKLVEAFDAQSLPKTIIIDKYGIVESIHLGAVNSALDLDIMLSNVLSDDYVPSKIAGALTEEEVTDDRVKPNVSMPDSSVIENAINGNGYTFSYYPETTEPDATYSWPWVVADDGVSIKPSNYTIDNSYAIIYSEFNLKSNKALAFDYKSSTESDSDILYVLIDGMLQAEISGETNGWQTCYPYVSISSGYHQLALVYMKDESSSVGEDAVYIKNMRIVDSSEIEDPIYILRTCYKGQSSLSGAYLFINPIYNEEDGFYHVDDVNGPLVFASLVSSTLWSDYTILDYANAGYLNDIAGVNYTDLIKEYAGYAVNSGTDLVPVTQELKDALCAIGKANPLVGLGDKEWLLMCYYYSAYGTDGKEFANPIEGLAPFSAYEAQLGENYVTFETTIVPRGKYSRFIPEQTGVYRVESEYFYTGDASIDAGLIHGTECWLFDENLNVLVKGYRDARENFATGDIDNYILYAYLEEGKTYYLCNWYDDLYRYTDLKFNISYVGESYDFLRTCTPAMFTTSDIDAFNNPTGEIIHGGIEAAISDEDGYYHYVDADGNMGSVIYCDFIYETEVFNFSILEMITMDAFNFGYDSEGNVVSGEDLTDEISSYEAKLITDVESELYGMVPVDARLAEILQKLLDKYTFKDVYQCWLKVCYYYQSFGA